MAYNSTGSVVYLTCLVIIQMFLGTYVANYGTKQPTGTLLLARL